MLHASSRWIEVSIAKSLSDEVRVTISVWFFPESDASHKDLSKLLIMCQFKVIIKRKLLRLQDQLTTTSLIAKLTSLALADWMFASGSEVVNTVPRSTSMRRTSESFQNTFDNHWKIKGSFFFCYRHECTPDITASAKADRCKCWCLIILEKIVSYPWSELQNPASWSDGFNFPLEE